METKHTKGKWEITPNKLVIVKSGTLDIISDCDTTDVETSLTKLEMEANAKLIAAAPELLDALILMSEYYIHDKSIDDGEYIEMEQKVINAIKKATT